jgi:hypothetical protein
MSRAINWFGLAAGIATILLIGISLYVPWWVVQVGDGLFQINTSPINTSFSLVGNQPFVIPLVWAFNLISILTLASGGIIMLIYSLVPTKSYSKKLLSFSYKKPLYAVVIFVVSLISIVIVARSAFGFNIPLLGAERIQVPQSMTFGATISALVTANFLWPFWLGIVTAGLCIAARLFHERVVSKYNANAAFPLPPPPPTS